MKKIFFFVFLLLISNRWLTLEQGLNLLHTNDYRSYFSIAEASPKFLENLDTVPFHHAQRWVVPYLLGGIGKLIFGDSLSLFFFFSLSCLVLSAVFFYKTLKALLPKKKHWAELWMLCLILNPYFFRYFLTLFGMTQDAVFILGLSVFCYGLVVGRMGVTFLGLLGGVLGRQNALLFLPIFLLANFKFERRTLKVNLVVILAGLAILAEYFSISRMASTFSKSASSTTQLLGLACWTKDWLLQSTQCYNTHIGPEMKAFFPELSAIASPPVFSQLAEYLLRLFVPVALPLGILWILNSVARLRLEKTTVLLSMTALSLPVVGIWMGPHIGSMAGTRYSTPMVLPLLILCAQLCRALPDFRTSPTQKFWIIFLIFTSSLHPVFSFLGLGTEYSKYFVVFALANWTHILWLLRSQLRNSQRSESLQ